MSQLILIRHGNTFEAGETPRYVGGKTDLPLTATGEQQGHSAAEMVRTRFVPVNAIISGPLQRTKRFAEMIAASVNNVFVIDERLCEISYGLWENKTSDEIKATFGAEALEAWEKRGEWPEGANWAPSKEKLERNIMDFLEEQHKNALLPKAGSRVVVTSNGILRFVYLAVTGLDPTSAAKVRTGNYCVLSPTPEGWAIEAWDMKP